MATLEQALTALLRDDPALVALIARRVYPGVLPQGVAYPAVTYQRISTARSQWRRLQDHKPSYERPRFQIDAYAKTPLAVQTVAAAVIELLDGFRGPAGPGSPQLQIASAVVEDEADGLEPEAATGGEHIYGRRIDVFVSRIL